MAESNSKLLNYIHLLTHNDDALDHYIVDPITHAEGIHGLTKAERAVMRRVVSGLSNNSANGYSMARNRDSYRRSLRLLQNVLHNVGSKMTSDVVSMSGEADTYPYSILVNYPDSLGDYTCKHGSDVNSFANDSICR